VQKPAIETANERRINSTSIVLQLQTDMTDDGLEAGNYRFTAEAGYYDLFMVSAPERLCLTAACCKIHMAKLI
jgi:hypothetical protein